jgi:glycerol-3-phosphate dehydrogenase (NAD(P)+)
MSNKRAVRVAVVGAGSWGTTVAALAAVNTPTVLWARRPELADAVRRDHRNHAYLPGFELPEALRATSSMEEAVADADVVVMGVPSHGFRAVLAEAAPFVRPWVPVVSLAKGLEQGTLKRMSEVVVDELPGHPVAVLTGPNLAKEILAGQPAASVVAVDDEIIASELQRIFATDRLRIYTNPDLVGCEVSGVVKNVIAIAAGMAEGMGFGDNTRATIITRGLAEMSRLGAAAGGDPMTFAGLAGMGDLIATCSSRQSRNNTVGFELGRGRTIEDIVGEMTMVAEGVKSSPSVVALAERHGVEMPIAEQVVEVCHRGRTAKDALLALMRRDPKAERAEAVPGGRARGTGAASQR